MTTKQAIQFFRSATRLAALGGVARAKLYVWGEYPPPRRQYQIEFLTRGRLKAEAELRRPAPDEWVDPVISARSKYHAMSRTNKGITAFSKGKTG